MTKRKPRAERVCCACGKDISGMRPQAKSCGQACRSKAAAAAKALAWRVQHHIHDRSLDGLRVETPVAPTGAESEAK